MRSGGALKRLLNGLAAPFGRFKPDVAARFGYTLQFCFVYSWNLEYVPVSLSSWCFDLLQAGQIARVKLPRLPHLLDEIAGKCKSQNIWDRGARSALEGLVNISAK